MARPGAWAGSRGFPPPGISDKQNPDPCVTRALNHASLDEVGGGLEGGRGAVGFGAVLKP